MVKSATQRQTERRERLRQNPGLYEEHLAKDRTRKKNQHILLEGCQLNAFRKRGKLATRKWRVLKNTKVKNDVNDKENVSSTFETSTPYKSVASFSKAKRRVENALPTCPMKKVAVVKRLAHSILKVKLPFAHASPKNAISAETRAAVQSFFLSNQISRVMPGKADTLPDRNEVGEKVKLQKQHLMMTIGEAFEIFKEENPDSKIGKSKFAELRPKQVLLSSAMPQNVCGCPYHSNVILILESLHRRTSVVPLYSKEFLCMCVCNPDCEKCMSNNCELCRNSTLLNEKMICEIANMDEPLTWFQWAKNDKGYFAKTLNDGTVRQAVDMLLEQMPKFLWHVFLKQKQSKAYEHDKRAAEVDESNEAIVQMDFSENFKVVYQDEIGSAHWRQKQVSLYTVMIWHRNTIKSLVIVSDVLEHEKKTVAAFTKQILDMIKSTLQSVKILNIWTDGPSSQFKNRYIFSLIPKLHAMYGLVIRWNYFATSHGKGPTDALGGTVKRMVHTRIMTRRAVVTDARSFCMATQMTSNKFDITLMNEDDIENACNTLNVEELWSELLAVPGTINTHFITNGIHGQPAVRKFYSMAPEIISSSKRPKDITQPRPEQSTSSAQVSSSVRHGRGKPITSKKEDVCHQCSVSYGDRTDPKIKEDWLKCHDCHGWFHESCAEVHNCT